MSDRLLIIGTTLATYSAFRCVFHILVRQNCNTVTTVSLLKHAIELKKPVMLLNVGPSRADSSPVVEKIDMPSGPIMSEVAQVIMCVHIYVRVAMYLILFSFSGADLPIINEVRKKDVHTQTRNNISRGTE